MKDGLETAQVQRAGERFILFSFCFLAFGFSVVFFHGCDGALRPMAGGVLAGDLRAEAVRVISEGVADDDPRIRASAIEIVAATKQVKLMPRVERLLKDDFVPVRFAAAVAVGDTEYGLARDKIKRLLKAPDENTRIAAAYAMVKLGSAESFGLIREALGSSDQTVRADAALLLGKSGDKKALRSLYRVLRARDSGDKARFQAVEAIAMLGDERIYSKAWAMLISVYADDRIMGVRAMGALGTEQAKNALITMLDDDILEVRLAAAGQLGKLEDSSGEPEVLEFFTKNLARDMDKEGVERVNVLAGLAIGRIGTASVVRFLPGLLKNESKLVRIAAAKAVFQCMTAN